MSKKSDPAKYESKFARVAGDRYFTEPWITEMLLDNLRLPQGSHIWEPAAGRGDMAKVMKQKGYKVFCTDVDVTELHKDFIHPHCSHNFLEHTLLQAGNPFIAIITNPPYFKKDRVSMAEHFVRKALSYDNVPLVAMLMRSEFMHVPSRKDLFDRRAGFALELLLPTRPRWDWWFRDKPVAQPRHAYSWFVWDRTWGKLPTFKFGEKPE